MRMEKAVFEIVTIYRKGQDLMSKAVGFVSKDVAGEKKKTFSLGCTRTTSRIL